jgi:Fe-S cluster assembly scaffold protein SufB
MATDLLLVERTMLELKRDSDLLTYIETLAREIMDCFSAASRVRKVVVKKSAQVGVTGIREIAEATRC